MAQPLLLSGAATHRAQSRTSSFRCLKKCQESKLPSCSSPDQFRANGRKLLSEPAIFRPRPDREADEAPLSQSTKRVAHPNQQTATPQLLVELVGVERLF